MQKPLKIKLCNRFWTIALVTKFKDIRWALKDDLNAKLHLAGLKHKIFNYAIAKIYNNH